MPLNLSYQSYHFRTYHYFYPSYIITLNLYYGLRFVHAMNDHPSDIHVYNQQTRMSTTLVWQTQDII